MKLTTIALASVFALSSTFALQTQFVIRRASRPTTAGSNSIRTSAIQTANPDGSATLSGTGNSQFGGRRLVQRPATKRKPRICRGFFLRTLLGECDQNRWPEPNPRRVCPSSIALRQFTALR